MEGNFSQFKDLKLVSRLYLRKLLPHQMAKHTLHTQVPLAYPLSLFVREGIAQVLVVETRRLLNSSAIHTQSCLWWTGDERETRDVLKRDMRVRKLFASALPLLALDFLRTILVASWMLSDFSSSTTGATCTCLKGRLSNRIGCLLVIALGHLNI